ncbi:acyl carrier protein [Nocardia sp. BMG111209]|uniref:acyl carrier protein n=1 Tax=Nocardia sp. BMG111209 TaxID=1160137 RepID=UPI00037B5D38|nr:acyl carrier protein [Nocardia sp. BMG111209]
MNAEERAACLLSIARNILSECEIGADDDLAERGVTSLAMIRILAEAARTLHLDIDPRELDGTVTVRNLAEIGRETS